MSEVIDLKPHIKLRLIKTKRNKTKQRRTGKNAIDKLHVLNTIAERLLVIRHISLSTTASRTTLDIAKWYLEELVDNDKSPIEQLVSDWAAVLITNIDEDLKTKGEEHDKSN